MEELSADVANVQRFHRSGTGLDKLNDAWTKVFSDVTQGALERNQAGVAIDTGRSEHLFSLKASG